MPPPGVIHGGTGVAAHGPGGSVRHDRREHPCPTAGATGPGLGGDRMADLVLTALTLAVFALLALVVRGVERL